MNDRLQQKTDDIPSGYESADEEIFALRHRVERERRARLNAELIAEETTRNLYQTIERLQASEAHREKIERHLNASQRMEAIGKLAGGIAHDFNNVLSVIQNYGGFLVDQIRTDDPMHADVLAILDASSRAAKLTRQLLAFGRKQIFEIEVVNLNRIITDIEGMLRRLIGASVHLKTTLKPGLGLVKADVSQFEQILVNLAVNARDAMPQGGSLMIETSDLVLDEVTHTSKSIDIPPGDYVTLSVTDTGHGMDAATVDRIFEPFFTTKSKDRGTGLGLSTVYGIVKQSGGAIWVYSEVGIGTTLRISLPRVEAPETVIRRESSPPAVLTGTESILVVEDDPLVRASTSRILRNAGYAVIEATNGQNALEVADSERHIDLVITDVIMPEMNGRQMADRLLARRPGLRLIFVSGYTEDAIHNQGVLDDTINFLQKPLSKTSLLTRVRDVLSTRLSAMPPPKSD